MHEILGILYRCSGAFPEVGVLQNVDEVGFLLPLKEVDDGYHVEEEAEAGVMNSLAVPRAANALALLACPEQVHWSMIGDQIGKKGGVALVDVLWQSFIKS